MCVFCVAGFAHLCFSLHSDSLPGYDTYSTQFEWDCTVEEWFLNESQSPSWQWHKYTCRFMKEYFTYISASDLNFTGKRTHHTRTSILWLICSQSKPAKWRLGVSQGQLGQGFGLPQPIIRSPGALIGISRAHVMSHRADSKTFITTIGYHDCWAG